MKKKKVLYFYVGKSTFVKKDIEIFSEDYKVTSFNFEVDAGAKWKIIFTLLRQFFFLISSGWNTDIFIAQFAGYHTFLPVLFAKITFKKSLIIAGGTECVAFPSIGYGNFQKKFLKSFTAWSLKNASHISPKHESLWYCKYDYTDTDFREQGIKFFIPRIKTPHTIIHNGYDGAKFFMHGKKIRKSFMTVTGAMNYSFQTALKGIDLILNCAKHLPDCTFTIVGALSEDQFPDKSQNVKVLTHVPNDQLIAMYSETEFYLQLSMAEGFPNALCESMLCECIPIGSSVFSIPDIISDTGFILNKRNTEMLIDLIKNAIAEGENDRGKKARERVLNHYPLIRRKNELKELLSKITRS